MAFEVPSADELKRIARANHIELTAAELTALQAMMPGQMAIIEQIPTAEPALTRLESAFIIYLQTCFSGPNDHMKAVVA